MEPASRRNRITRRQYWHANGIHPGVTVGVSSRNNNKRDIVGSAVRIPQHFEEVVMESNNAAGLVDGLVDDVQKNLNFRDESARVGAVYTMSYQLATVATYDYDREQAGGLPKGGFLVAAEPQGDNGFILLRILKEARLPNADANDQTRQQAIEKTGNEEPWANALDTWMANQVSLHGIECRILGTFIDQGDGTVRFAEDTDNYFAVTSLMVWKPGPRTLDKIVNYRHRRNALAPSDRKQVGDTRFAAAEGGSATRVPFLLDPTDLLQRRTVYLGMSRSGKSNAMKITAEAIYRLREVQPDVRIGQLIFDPNGEYAQDNPQDGPGLHRIHEAVGLQRKDEVETYGLFAPPTDSSSHDHEDQLLRRSVPSSMGHRSRGGCP